MKGEEGKEKEGRGENLRVPDQKKKKKAVSCSYTDLDGCLRRRAGRSAKAGHRVGTL